MCCSVPYIVCVYCDVRFHPISVCRLNISTMFLFVVVPCNIVVLDAFVCFVVHAGSIRCVKCRFCVKQFEFVYSCIVHVDRLELSSLKFNVFHVISIFYQNLQTSEF